LINIILEKNKKRKEKEGKYCRKTKKKVIHCKWEKKVKKKRKSVKTKVRKKINTLWIIIVIHIALGVSEQWIPHTL
jgi:hypothetical protein